MGLSSSSPWLKYYGKTPASLDYPHATMYQMVAAAARRKPVRFSRIHLLRRERDRIRRRHIFARRIHHDDTQIKGA